MSSLNEGVSITAGNYFYTDLGKLERFLIALIDQYDGRYVVQHPEHLIKLSSGWSTESSEEDTKQLQQRFFPSLDRQQMSRWLKKNSSTYLSVPQWQLDISRSALATGTRIHGVQMALQAGVPAVCLYVDSRTKELCDTMQIPNIDARNFQQSPSVERLLEVLENWNREDYDANRQKLAYQTANFIEQDKLSCTPAFKLLAQL